MSLQLWSLWALRLQESEAQASEAFVWVPQLRVGVQVTWLQRPVCHLVVCVHTSPQGSSGLWKWAEAGLGR